MNDWLEFFARWAVLLGIGITGALVMNILINLNWILKNMRRERETREIWKTYKDKVTVEEVNNDDSS